MFNFSQGDRDAAAAELQQKINALPKPFKAWRQEMIDKHARPLKQAAAERDKALAAIRREMAPHVAARDKARAELEAARAFVADVPLDAAVEEVATQAVIADQWPARVGGLNARVNEFQEQINAVEAAHSAAELHAQAELDLAYRDAMRALQETKPVLIRELG